MQEFRTSHELSVEATAQFTRTELAQFLRKSPYQVNLLIAGYDTHEGVSKLYWMDYLGTLQQVTKGAHGYAAYFVNSVLDNNFNHNMKLEDGIATLRKCIQELKTRFIINQPTFIAKVVTKEGIRVIDL